jgi:GDP-4-dehydro-6-deoxy-D-mannose reductase
MSGTTLVTGATGFVGGHLLDRLVDRAPVVAWYRPGGQPPDPHRPLEWRGVDLLDAGAVADGLQEAAPARVFHIAGAPQVASSWQSVVPHLQTNVLGTHHLIEGMRHLADPCRVLVITSAQIYQLGDEPIDEDAPLVPPNPYGLSKLAQDQLALRSAADFDLDIVVARPFNHAGPRQSAAFALSNFARQIAWIEARLVPPRLRVGNLDTRRDMTDVRDVVEAYDELMTHAPGGRPYNICSGRAWRIGDLLEELLHLSRMTIAVEADPSLLRPHDVPVVQGDATRIRTEIGWQPRISIEQTLSDTLEWWRGEVRAGRSMP